MGTPLSVSLSIFTSLFLSEHKVTCLSHSLTEHIPLCPVLLVCRPVQQELPVRPALRSRRHCLQYRSLSARTLSLSSMFNIIHDRQVLGNIGRSPTFWCLSSNF